MARIPLKTTVPATARITALSALLWSGAATGALAQEYETGGIQLTFGLGLGLETQSNRNLSAGDPGASTELGADLSFGVLTETRTQRLLFEAGGRLRTLDTPGGNAEGNGFVRPSLRLDYDRSAAAARLQFRARLSETDVSEVETLEIDLIDVVLASGTATRRTAFVEGRIDWRMDRPFGFGVLARVSDVAYRDGVATGLGGTNLNDNRRFTFGVNARFDLTPAARLTTSLTYDAFEQDGISGQRETVSLSNTLTIDRPLGPLTISSSVDSTEDGERVSAAVGRRYELPWGVVSGTLGVTRGVAGDTFMTGSVNAAYPLPRGNLTLGLSRGVSSGNEEDTERVNNQVTFGYLQEIDPLSSISFGANWAEVEETGTGNRSSNTTLTATYTRELTRDWNMDLGYRHRRSDDSTGGSANSDELFFNLRRTFVTRF